MLHYQIVSAVQNTWYSRGLLQGKGERCLSFIGFSYGIFLYMKFLLLSMVCVLSLSLSLPFLFFSFVSERISLCDSPGSPL